MTGDLHEHEITSQNKKPESHSRVSFALITNDSDKHSGKLPGKLPWSLLRTASPMT